MKELSIIIPHYNTHELLKKLLKSIPDKETIEVIVVDDNSTEKNRELDNIVKVFQENFNKLNFKFLKNNSKRKGAGACRNIGLDNATGKWLIFADSDDYFEENFYEKISKHLYSDNDLVVFAPISREESGTVSTRHIERKKLVEDFLGKRNYTDMLNLKYKFPEPWSKLYKHHSIKENGIRFQETIVSNDKLFSAKVGFFLKKVHASREVIYCVTKRKNSLTTTISDEMFTIRVRVFIDYYKFLEKKLEETDFCKLELSASEHIFSLMFKKYSKECKKTCITLLLSNNVKLFNSKSVFKYLNIIQRTKSLIYNKKFF